MATLKRRGARKPMIENGGVYTGTDVLWEQPSMSRAIGTLYTLSVCGPGTGNRNDEVVLALTEDQMLDTAMEWLKLYKRELDNRRRRANG